MKIQQTYEITLNLDTKKFNKLKQRMRPDKGKHTAGAIVTEGIEVTFHDNQYKPKIKLSVTPNWVLNSDEPDHPKLIRKVEEYITDNFGSKFRLDDFRVTGMLLVADIDVQSRKRAADYLKVLQRIGKVKGFSPLSDPETGDGFSFRLKGNSNGIEFGVFDLESVLKTQVDKVECGRKQYKEIIKKSEGLLRAEIRLAEMKAIRVWTNETDNAKQLKELTRRSKDIFLDTFMRVIPLGDFYKKDEAVEIVWRDVEDGPIKRRMLRLLDLVPEKKSLHLAQKTLDYRKLERVMDMFDGIQLSPVTISKRHDVQRLDSLYRYM